MRRLAALIVCIAAAPAFAGEVDLRSPDARDTREDRKDVERFVARVRHEVSVEGRLILAEARGRVTGIFRRLEPDWTPREVPGGSLERGPGGVPIVRLSGTPEQRGEQHGRLLAKESRALAETYLRSFLGPSELRAARKRAREQFEEHLSGDERREIAAFARASGISEDDAFLAQSFTDLYRAWSCSTIANGVGEPLLARNLDFLDMGFIHRFSCVFVVRPDKGEAYVSIGWPGLIGVLSGQNERGVALSVMVVHDDKRCSDGVPFQLAFRRALLEARSANDIGATLAETQLTVANNLSVVDRHGRARVFELAPDGVVAREGTRLVSTNHFMSQARREPRASFSYLSSLRRYDAVQNLACPAGKTDGPLTIETAIDALKASGPSISNVQAMVFEPRAGAVNVSIGTMPAAKGKFVRLSREDLFGK